MKVAAFAFLAVAAAFSATLYYGGRALDAWGDPGKELVAPPAKPLPKLAPLRPVKARVSSDWSRWVDAANAHCSRVVGQIANLQQPRTLDEEQAYVQQFWQLNKQWSERLAALRSPRGFGPQVRRLRRLSVRYAGLVDSMLGAVRSGDTAEYSRDVTQMAAIVSAEVDVLARMGAGGCVASTHT